MNSSCPAVMSQNSISQPVEKTLTVLEHLAAVQTEHVSLTELSQACSVPKATLYRIVSTLCAKGYVEKHSDKTYASNTRIVRKLPADHNHRIMLTRQLHHILEQSKQSVEILTVADQSLYWNEKQEHPDPAIHIKACQGFRRTLYELDAPARLYLGHLGLQRVRKEFNSGSFYTTGTDCAKVSWRDASRIIKSTDPGEVVYDTRGNSNGIRRFAALITDTDHQFLYLLCIAEPAVPKHNQQRHIEKMTALLKQTANKLRGAT